MIPDGKNEREHDAYARVGELLKGKYRLDALLGFGGMAAVYAATHRNGNRVAIKILLREAALIPSLRNRFLREGYLANRVDHPQALSVIDDDFDEQGTAYLVMELLSGENLEDRCAHLGGYLDVAEVLVVAYQALDVLVRAHAKNIVHRDLKPSNLFLEDSGNIKILDFGIARLYTPSSGPGETAGAPLGTPGFMPPEQARGRSEDVGPASDIWALGATMFFLLANRFVHDSEGTLSEQLVAAMNEPAPFLQSAGRELPESVCALVDRALEYDPQDRWPSAAAMKEEVATVYFELTGNDIRSAPRLRLACPQLEPMPDASHAEAPTVEANSGQGTAPTATPFTSQRSRTTQRPRGRWVLVAVITGGLALTVGVIGSLQLLATATGRPPKSLDAKAAVRSPLSPTPSAVAPSAARVAPSAFPEIVPNPSASSAPPPEPTVASSAPSSVAPPPPRRAGPWPPAPKPKRTASPESTPDKPIDIFSRRR